MFFLATWASAISMAWLHMLPEELEGVVEWSLLTEAYFFEVRISRRSVVLAFCAISKAVSLPSIKGR